MLLIFRQNQTSLQPIWEPERKVGKFRNTIKIIIIHSQLRLNVGDLLTLVVGLVRDNGGCEIKFEVTIRVQEQRRARKEARPINR